MLGIFSSTTAKVLGGASALGLVSVPVISTVSSADFQSNRTVGGVSTSQGGVGSKKDLQKPEAYRPAPAPVAAPVYTPPPPPPAPVAAPPPPPAPVAAPPAAPVAAAASEGGGIGGVLLGVLGAAAVIGGVVLLAGNDDDEPTSP